MKIFNESKMVIFGSKGNYKVTDEANYNSRVMNKNKVIDCSDFDSVRELIDYLVKYAKCNENEFIVHTSDGIVESLFSDDGYVGDTFRRFRFTCRDCNNEFVDEYDYPLPSDCEAAVYCPQCGGVAKIIDTQPLEESVYNTDKWSTATMDSSIEEWYKSNFPTDYQNNQFDTDGATFRDFQKFIDSDYNPQQEVELFGFYPDSVIIERLAEELALIEQPLTESDSEENEFDVAETDQKYTSANTSINSTKLPAIFRMVKFEPNTINLDYGGGKFDNVAEALEPQGVENLVYDPYNRSAEHNSNVIKQVKSNKGADTVTCSNVLNVIAEPEARFVVLKNIYNLSKPNAECYFTVYEGDGSGEGKETKSGYQLNRKTADYVDEISKIFPNVTRKGKLIIATK